MPATIILNPYANRWKAGESRPGIEAAFQKAGIDFNVAYIPNEFDVKAKEPFDPEYMSKLFDLGYRMALSGYPWEKTAPGF